MNLPVKRALISVADKTGLLPLAKALQALGVALIASGGTYQYLVKNGLQATEISMLTGMPEMMEGRVKTLHPAIHAGILGQRDRHMNEAKMHGIEWIDLVIVNCYPFAECIAQSDCTREEAIENIDIGGVTLIRAAAKNHAWVSVVVDPADYGLVVDSLRAEQTLSFSLRQDLAAKAFAYTAQYDRTIADYFTPLQTKALRYGENPHQAASAYSIETGAIGLLDAVQHQGKALSYNNLVDGDAALRCVQEFADPAVVIVKHANPCGIAVANYIETAWQQALATDSLSAFGGVVALNRECTLALAKNLIDIFLEIIVAPSFAPAALEILAKKPKLRLLTLPIEHQGPQQLECKSIQGGLLIQEMDQSIFDHEHFNVVTKQQPHSAEMVSLQFAWQAVKHVKSNAIVIAKGQQTLAIGAGQTSRIDAVRLAIHKAGVDLNGAVLASDAFFPFRDNIDLIAEAGIKTIIQPGGSLRDREVIEACDQYGIAMIFTGVRCFKH